MTGLDLDPEGVGELLPQGLRAPVAAARLRPGAAALEEPRMSDSVSGKPFGSD
jgi:hypothetical protein